LLDCGIEPEIAEGFRSLKRLHQETKGKSRHSERAAGFALGLGSLGNRISQGELLSGDTNPLGIAAGRLLHFVTGMAKVLRHFGLLSQTARWDNWHSWYCGGFESQHTSRCDMIPA